MIVCELSPQGKATSTLGTVFQNNKVITSAKELQYFTGQTGNWSSTFNGASALEKLYIPAFANSNCYINWNAIRGNTVLQYIYILSETYIKMSGSNGLASTNNCPVYVPDSLLQTYKTSDGWAQYASRIFPWSDFTE